MDVSFSYVCPAIDNEFRHNIFKLVCGSTRLSPCGSTATLTMLWWNSWTITIIDAWKTDVNLLNWLICVAVQLCNFTGRFHTRGRTNHLDGQIVLDEQIVWCENGTNNFFDRQIIWYLAVWKDGFLKTICLSRWTSQRQYDLNSHQTVKWLIFSPRGNGTSNRARFYGKFQHGGTQEETIIPPLLIPLFVWASSLLVASGGA